MNLAKIAEFICCQMESLNESWLCLAKRFRKKIFENGGRADDGRTPEHGIL